MLFWFIIIGIALYVEFITIQLVSLPFVFGGMAGLSAYLFGLDFTYQLVIFIITSMIALWIMQKVFRKKLVPKQTETNLGLLVGKQIQILELDASSKKGAGKVNGVNWTIISDEEMNLTDQFFVKNINGTTLVVGRGN